jgi:hypothetical protein
VAKAANCWWQRNRENSHLSTIFLHKIIFDPAQIPVLCADYFETGKPAVEIPGEQGREMGCWYTLRNNKKYRI